MNEKPLFADLQPPPMGGEFAEAIAKRLAYRHLSDFGYKIIVDLGCPWFFEEPVTLGHMRVTVPHEFVESVKKLAYEYTPIVMRTDVVGSDALPESTG